MSPTEAIRKMIAAVEAGDYSGVAGVLDRDFTFAGSAPHPLGRGEFLEFARAIHGALPDVKYNLKITAEKDSEWVRGEIRFTGTHAGELDLPYLPKVPATRRSVKIAAEKFVAKVHDGKIVSFSIETGPNSGLMGILKQIGREDLADCLRAGNVDCRTMETGPSAVIHI